MSCPSVIVALPRGYNANSTIPKTPNWFNVKDYGAKGDTQSVTDAIPSGTNTVTSASANFKKADVGKVCYAVYAPDATLHVPQGVITSFINPNTITVSTTVSDAGVECNFVWGTDDTAALKAAWQAAIATANTITGGEGGMSNVYVPTGGYLFSYLPFASPSKNPGPSLLGDGIWKTVFYTTPNYNFTTGGYQPNGGILLLSNDGGSGSEVANFSFWGANLEFPLGGAYAGCIVDVSGVPYVHNIVVTTLGAGGGSNNIIGGIYASGGATGVWLDVHTVDINGPCYGLYINNCDGNCLILNCGTSNGGVWVINGVNGGTSYLNEGSGLTIVGILNDESNGGISFVNSSRCRILGCSLFGNAGSLPLSIDATSDVTIIGSDIGTYSYDISCIAVQVAAGGILRLGSTHIYSTGVSGSAIALINAGTIYDMGGNTIESITNTGTIEQVSYNSTATTATAGSATAVAPAGYTLEMINGVLQKRAYYNV
jgi:hypothetical protein